MIDIKVTEEDRERHRKCILEEKGIERKIKEACEEIQNWFEIEMRIYKEKSEELKKYYEEVCREKHRKKKELSERYGGRKCDNVQQKYKISL